VNFAPIETDRFLLHPPGADDAEALSAILDDAEVARHSPGLPHPYPPAAVRDWISRTRRQLLAGAEFAFVIRDRQSRALVGLVELALAGQRAVGELAYWIARDRWNQGIGTEAARRMVGFGFDSLGLAEVWGIAMTENPASVRVLEKAHLAYQRDDTYDSRPVVIHRVDRPSYRQAAGLDATRVVYVAAAALIDDAGRVLLAQRPPGKVMAGLWEFPGGKVEPGERPALTLARELSEELGLEIGVGEFEPFSIVCHRYEDFQLLMPLMLCRRWPGAPNGKEGQVLAWATGSELSEYLMPAADVPLVGELQRLLAT
jgi:8-oxo-dGTP diphosphatase